MPGFASRAARITSVLFAMPADVRIRLRGGRDAGFDQRFGPRRVAVDRIDAFLPDRANRVDVQLDDRRLDAAFLQQARDGLPVGP